MAGNVPETEFYQGGSQEQNENYTLWRNVSRLYEDFASFESPQREERFKTVLKDILAELEHVE